jgi:hypothetical protein
LEPEFAPAPGQVVSFLDGLSTIGAAPADSTLIVMKPSGRVRYFTDPLTGEKKSFPAQDRIIIGTSADLVPNIGKLMEYSVALDGQGPPTVPPFPVYADSTEFTDKYGLVVRCCLKSKAISMSAPYGNDSSADPGNGMFYHPLSGKTIEISGTGRARFWVEFEFGKWLLPKIEDSPNILEPAIPVLAQKSFGVEFTQGFYFL